jgi:nitroimidazol reductase NimA-like FMN-containing flavoprotein (pyridoxamine 5'-phosphate oxidase superfamily)
VASKGPGRAAKGYKFMRNIRRKDRQIGTDEAIDLLKNCEYGVLSTIGSDGQPYGVPLSYVYKDHGIYFHCALTGHKIENIQSNPKVSFCAVGNTNVLPAEFGTEYESVIAFGVAAEIQGEEKDNALLWLLEKYCPDFIEEGKRFIEEKKKATKVIKIQIGHMSGKARR